MSDDSTINWDACNQVGIWMAALTSCVATGIEKGDEAVIRYVVPGRGHYSLKTDARRHMQPGDQLYVLKAKRIE